MRTDCVLLLYYLSHNCFSSVNNYFGMSAKFLAHHPFSPGREQEIIPIYTTREIESQRG